MARWTDKVSRNHLCERVKSLFYQISRSLIWCVFKGKLLRNDDSFYEGEYKNGKKHGQGSNEKKDNHYRLLLLLLQKLCIFN